MAVAISAQNISRRFEPTVPVLDRVSFSISSGEFVAMLGPSGCGKSTCLRLIAGLDVPDEGSLLVDPQPRGFVFQDANLLPWLNVLRNVALPLELRGMARPQAEARAETELRKVGLADALNRYPMQLSGGMKMRASLARALVTDPRLLLLDEPFSALDETSRHSLQDELRRIWETSGMTVVFVTHSVSEAVFLSNRAIVFSNAPGRVVRDAPIDLPRERPSALRLDPHVMREMKKIYDGVPITESHL